MEVAYGRVQGDALPALPVIGKNRARAESITSTASSRVGGSKPVKAEGQVKYLGVV